MSAIPHITAESVEQYTKLELLAIINAFQQQVQQLQARIVELEEKVAALSKNSSTSSKPPSSDIVKPPKAKGGVFMLWPLKEAPFAIRIRHS